MRGGFPGFGFFRVGTDPNCSLFIIVKFTLHTSQTNPVLKNYAKEIFGGGILFEMFLIWNL